MSTGQEHTDPFYRKKRKIILRACDNCRRKKIRRNEPEHPHNKCSACIENDLDCTYEGAPKKRGRTAKGYVEDLEQRVQMLEVVLKKLCPDQKILYDLLSPLDPEYAASITSRHVATSASSFKLPSNPSTAEPSKETPSSSSVLNVIHKIASLSLSSQDDPFRDEEDSEHIDTAARIKSLTQMSEENRFWGKSSGANFLVTAISAKNEYTKDAPAKRRIFQGKRPIFWTRLPWVENPIRSLSVKYLFPPPDLITTLTIAYFEHVNLFYPLLHRPTFERSVANNLHFRDEGFGSILLLVCAVGSRYTDKIDPRSLLDGADSGLSAGWKWYSQVELAQVRLLEPLTLYELQSYCLAVQFLIGSYSPQAIWNLLGLGIRFAQDVGVHRRRMCREMLTVEDELWKRAFWVLVAIDRTVSVLIGRQCAIFDEHFDLDLPIECDDEYWEHPDPKKRFRQPDGVPSTVTAFNQRMQLNKIITFTLNTIYSIKTKFWELISKEWEQHIVAELDSAMNNWISSLPEYLRWDPNRTDNCFFRLSGCLASYYYYIQILIHRRYISTKNQPTPLAFPSLAICNSAARSCSMVLEQHMERNGITYPHMQMAAVPTAIVLLLNTWGSKRSGLTAYKDMRHIEQCLNVLKKAEERWHSAGRLLDVLNGLASFGDLVTPDHDRAVRPKKLRASCSYVKSQERSTVEKQQDAPESSFLDSTVPLSQQSLPSKNMNDISHMRTLPTASATFNDSYSIFDAEYPEQSRNQSYDPYNFMTAGYPTFGDVPNNAGTSTFSENITLDLNMDLATFTQQQAIVDTNTMAMWLTAPTSFQINEWNTFVTEFAELTNELGVNNQSDSAYTL